MKKIDTSAISNTIAMPVKAGSIVHLIAAFQEIGDALAKNLIQNYQTNTVYILFGCVNTGVSPAINISAGAVYYNGEVFLVDAFSGTPGGGNVTLGTIATTNFTDPTADPVTFTDGTPRSVHQVRKVALSFAASGSGIADYSNWLQSSITLVPLTVALLANPFTVKFDQNRSYFFTGTQSAANYVIQFDFTNAVPGAVVRMKFTLAVASTLAISGAAGQTIIKDEGTLASAANANNLLYMLYVGKNESGNFEVSWVLKQV